MMLKKKFIPAIYLAMIKQGCCNTRRSGLNHGYASFSWMRKLDLLRNTKNKRQSNSHIAATWRTVKAVKYDKDAAAESLLN